MLCDSLLHGLQHARPPCPSPAPRVCSNSCPLSWGRHPTMSFSVTLFCSCPQSFPASGSSPVSQLSASGGQSTGASAPASVFPMNIQGRLQREAKEFWPLSYWSTLSAREERDGPKWSHKQMNTTARNADWKSGSQESRGRPGRSTVSSDPRTPFLCALHFAGPCFGPCSLLWTWTQSGAGPSWGVTHPHRLL